MKKWIQMISLIAAIILLAGCNFPGQEAEPTVDIVATQVAKMLTEGATEVTQETGSTLTPTNPAVETTEAAQEATATATASATITPTATSTENLDDPAQQLGNPAWTENFDGNDSPWDFSYDQATFNTANGFLTMTATTNPNWHSWYVSSPKLQNAYLETTIQMSNCSGLDKFGLAFRATSDGQQFYFMGVTCDGQWGFYRMAPDVNIIEIQGYQPAPQLANGTDQPHRIGVKMEGSSFTFYIDGEKLTTLSDSKLTGEGYTGFLIAYANVSGFTVKVDDLKYWTLN